MKEEKLQRLLKYVQKNNPYYKDILAGLHLDMQAEVLEAYEKIPPMNKEILMKNYDRLISSEVKPDDLIWEHTSGTSGVPLKMGKTQEERSRFALKLMKWRKKHFGVEMGDNYGYFTTITEGLKYYEDRNILFMSEINLDDASFNLYYELMVSKRIRWMFSTPTVTYILMNYMKRYHKPPIETLRYIELTGEQILPAEKEAFSKFFGCPVAEQYGIREMWAIAKECKHKKLHILEDDVLLHYGKGQKTYVTALDQYAMPIIRYEVDDELVEGSTCDCDCNYTTLQILKSRALVFLHIGKDIIISPILLRICITRLIYDYKFNIEQFRFEQHNYDDVLCIVKCSNGQHSAQQISDKLTQLVNELYPLPNNFKINVKEVDSLLSFMKRGKLGYFVSYIQ